MTNQTKATENEQIYFCSRPRIASMLIELGYKCTIKPSPFREGWYSWDFPITGDLALIVSDYYLNTIQKPVPVSIKKALEKDGEQK